MYDFKPGQRWISDADLQLGLGTVLAVEARTVSISFLATDETRNYARQSAPLTRAVFSVGDSLPSHEGWLLTVETVTEHEGLLTYYGTDEDGNKAELAEGLLANVIQLNRPVERLFNGHIDRDKWFQLRYQTLLHRNRLARTELHGLTGSRASLIPHQLYIAHEVAHRYAPRVLLADEVGLGKTIEAGLILHHQLLTERAKRVLIVVPETLLHQWLVEMLRRFNLHFSVFDKERCDALDASSGQDNPFHTEQLILCSLDFLSRHQNRFQQAVKGDWDLLVVDEAHHLQWSEQAPSPEYQMIEQLAAHTEGVLLLTATPEQLGKASHFARLRLLDPHRFSDFDAFVEEEKSYEPIARAVEVLLAEQVLDDTVFKIIASTIQESDNQQLLDTLRNTGIDSAENLQARKELVELLLDRHGTGRILFRNTRAAVKGFPDRRVIAEPLPIPTPYSACLAGFQTAEVSEPQLLLCPELLYQASVGREAPHWTRIDPRINWLANTLKQLRLEKVLVITASMQSALDIAQALKVQIGMHASVFHEQMSLVERDRAAAYFADKAEGSQLLVCSEIGSEGRNFQFAHHLVLFDLPLNPDLLEQRIGRLDRIGQTETINIHVPYLENSAQAVMFHWYHQGLDAFKHTCPAGQTVFLQVESALKDALHQQQTSLDALSELISTTQTANRELNDALHKGRDKLLEYNSFRPDIANALKEHAELEDASDDLLHYMDAAFDCFGVHLGEHRTGSYIIQPGEHMVTPFPGLHDDGMTITYSRDVALANEDIHFLAWEHPMVINAMDMVLSSEFGNAVVSSVQHQDVKPGTLLLESLYLFEAVGHSSHQSSRYLPPTMIRILVDEHGNSDYPGLLHGVINSHQELVPVEIAKQVIQLKKTVIRELVSVSEDLAKAQTPKIIAAAHKQIEQTFTQEIARLKALRKVNPNVREEEIQFFEQQLQSLARLFDSAKLRLDALRVIIAT